MFNGEVVESLCNPGRLPRLLGRIVDGKEVVDFGRGQTIFFQGGPADSIYFVDTGKVKITVVSDSGKEAVLAMLGPEGFFGEDCLVARSDRMNTASALEPSRLVRIERASILRAINDQPELCQRMMNIMLIRKCAAEEDFCDQLFNQCEKRLARALLKLAPHRESSTLDAKIPGLSHETLSGMIGTTRSRVTHFMNKFRKMGLIDYQGDVHTSGHLLVRPKQLTAQILQN